MRIISGKHKRKKIKPPPRLKLRPTTDRAKEGLFNILENRFDLKIVKVLDLYSGTGSISYEFCSRGCKQVTAVDKDLNSTKFITKMSIELDMKIKTINQECLDFLKKEKNKYDIIFADPPYCYENYKELINIINQKGILNPQGNFILEHGSNLETLLDTVNTRKYGNVFFTIFNK